MSFVLTPSPYDRIPEILKAAAPAFTASDEYQRLLGNAEDLPGVVLASFARFLARLARVSASDAALASGLAAVSELWASDDPRTRVAIEDEFFESLASQTDAVPLVVGLMKPQLRDAYLTWAARPF